MVLSPGEGDKSPGIIHSCPAKAEVQLTNLWQIPAHPLHKYMLSWQIHHQFLMGPRSNLSAVCPSMLFSFRFPSTIASWKHLSAAEPRRDQWWHIYWWHFTFNSLAIHHFNNADTFIESLWVSRTRWNMMVVYIPSPQPCLLRISHPCSFPCSIFSSEDVKHMSEK